LTQSTLSYSNSLLYEIHHFFTRQGLISLDNFFSNFFEDMNALSLRGLSLSLFFITFLYRFSSHS